MLTDFTIRNFRGIKELTLPSLKRVNLLVGKNGVGKTSVLEAVQLYASGFDAAVAREFLVRRNEDVLILNNRELLLRVTSDGREESRVALGPMHRPTDGRVTTGHTQGVMEAYFALGDGTGIGARIPRDSDPSPEKRKLPLPQLFVPSTMLSHDVFSELWGEVEFTSNDDRVVEIVKLLAPELEKITTRKFPNKPGLVPIAKVRGIEGPIPLSRLGEGVSRLAGLALALVATQGGTVLIDEFENGLHYSTLKQTWQFVLRMADSLDVQVLATTHSRDVVYALAEATEETDDAVVIRLERHGDKLTARTIEQDMLTGVVEQEVEIR